ncbi:TonB-dependent receptor plug domain-containing protein [Polyangium sp. 15x6]|uniref:TonB-dependent receptor n=1 Tax=Polyangium sp. 15x6 TaxID=3042687 RepID=UPI00249A0E83|nr:TonB-dependent receptor plug domain-containing protein [Polyangium sp. 15x6]MDI3281859.1 TonB-dependent receptor plug domain-containing protein [Polyangium sp. 15x6]
MAALAVCSFSRAAHSDEPREVTVRAAPRKRDPGRTTVRADEARRVAGTRDDALRIVESLPGVARGGYFGGGLVLWGAAPGDSRVTVDGVEIPLLYHGNGLRGVLPSGLVQAIDLAPGAYGAEYGRALGGLVRVTTRDLPAEGIHGSIGADLLDAAGMVSAAVGDRVRVAAAARASHFDRLVSAVAPPSVLDVVPIPRYHDYQLKATLALREDEELSAVLLGAGDALTRAQPSSDPAKTRIESTETSFQRFYLRYTRALPEGANVVIVPFFGRDRERRDASFGGVPQARDALTWRYGLRASYRAPITDAVVVTAGVDALASRASLFRQGSLTLPPREGDLYVFGQPPGSDVNADDWSTNVVDVGPFLVAELRFGPFLVTPGLRADLFLVEGSRSTPRVGQPPGIGSSRLLPALDPRLSVSVSPVQHVTLSASGGLYHQPPAAEDLGPVFGTPNLTLARSVHASAGASVRLPAGLGVEVTGFFVSLDDLVVRSRLPTPKLAAALTQEGEGENFGVQVLARRQLQNGIYGWIAYTASRSERRYAGDASSRRFDHDQTHVLTATAGYEWRGWTFGIRFRHATGAPRTPVVGSFDDVTTGRFQPIFGVQNGTRLPSFQALDLRVQKAIAVRRASVVLSLDVTNATNQENPEEIVYNYDFSRKSFISGLPALAILGARVEL